MRALVLEGYYRIIFALFILISDLWLSCFLGCTKFAPVYHISSNLDNSGLRYGGISIFKMLTSSILDFRD